MFVSQLEGKQEFDYAAPISILNFGVKNMNKLHSSEARISISQNSRSSILVFWSSIFDCCFESLRRPQATVLTVTALYIQKVTLFSKKKKVASLILPDIAHLHGLRTNGNSPSRYLQPPNQTPAQSTECLNHLPDHLRRTDRDIQEGIIQGWLQKRPFYRESFSSLGTNLLSCTLYGCTVL